MSVKTAGGAKLLGSSALEKIPLDNRKIRQSQLNIEDKVRSNLFPWKGQFSPQLVSALIDAYSDKSSCVLDPFMGSGTVLIEAARQGLPALGADINPAPYKIASIYRLVNIEDELKLKILDATEELLEKTFPMPLFAKTRKFDQQEIKDLLVGASEDLASQLDESNPRPFVRILVDALIVLLDFNKPGLNCERVFSTWNSLREKVSQLPHSGKNIDVFNCDARALPLEDDSVNLVITSPPYINVFNYHQKYRRSLEAIGWDLLDVARSEIGSNRKHRSNRFLTVIQYCIDMASVLAELCRVCGADSRMIFIVGRESNVRKTAFYNGELTARLAVECLGLEILSRQERVFKNRFGGRIYEDILHINNRRVRDRLASPSEIARQLLCEAQDYAPDESLADLDSAIDQIESVQASPIYTAGNRSAPLAYTSPVLRVLGGLDR